MLGRGSSIRDRLPCQKKKKKSGNWFYNFIYSGFPSSWYIFHHYYLPTQDTEILLFDRITSLVVFSLIILQFAMLYTAISLSFSGIGWSTICENKSCHDFFIAHERTEMECQSRYCGWYNWRTHKLLHILTCCPEKYPNELLFLVGSSDHSCFQFQV